jgi:hypothetical protein
LVQSRRVTCASACVRARAGIGRAQCRSHDAIAGTVKEAVTTYKSWNENRKRRAARLSKKQANLASKEGARTPISGHAPTCANTPARTHARLHTGARELEHSSAPSAATRTARNSSALGAAEEQSSSAVFGGDGRAQNPPNSSERPNKLAQRQVQPGGILDDHPRPVAAQPRNGGCAPGATSIASEPPDSADEAGAAGASGGAYAYVRPCVGACVFVRESACVQGSASWL